MKCYLTFPPDGFGDSDLVERRIELVGNGSIGNGSGAISDLKRQNHLPGEQAILSMP